MVTPPPAAGHTTTLIVLVPLVAASVRLKLQVIVPTGALPDDGGHIQPMHVALINVDLLKALGGKAAPPTFTAESVKTKADILKAMADSYDYGTALLNEESESTIGQPVKDSPAWLGPATRARIFWTLLAHTMDIYGQMAVYLRLNGIVPPASRGV